MTVLDMRIELIQILNSVAYMQTTLIFKARVFSFSFTLYMLQMRYFMQILKKLKSKQKKRGKRLKKVKKSKFDIFFS